MLLIDQIELLRINLSKIESMNGVLPILGGPRHTQQAYKFVHLVHPARDIITTVHAADKSGTILPGHLRGWNIDVKDGNENTLRTNLKKILNMIIHMNYLCFADDLDVIDRSNHRVIVSRELFLKELNRLLLNHDDICLVACAWAHEACRRRVKNDQAIEPVDFNEAEFCDLHNLLSNISSMPELQEVIWNTYFNDNSSEIDARTTIVNDQPFINGSRSTCAGLIWRIGWRRDNLYSKVWVDIIALITTIHQHIHNN